VRGRTRNLIRTTAILVGAASVLRADALDGVLEVRSAYVNVDSGVFLLHSRIQYPDNPGIRDALRDGITLSFDLDVPSNDPAASGSTLRSWR
jgi:hypothetical protein